MDRINILQASLLAMQRAVDALGVQPSLALIDGNRCPPLSCPAQAIIGGDGLVASIAAASILAKTQRDAGCSNCMRSIRNTVLTATWVTRPLSNFAGCANTASARSTGAYAPVAKLIQA